MVRTRLFLETMEEVLPAVRTVIVEPGTAVMPYLPLDERAKRRAARACAGRRRSRAVPTRAGASATPASPPTPHCAFPGRNAMRRVIFALLVLSAIFAALVWAGEVGVGPVVITREGEQKIVLLFGSPVSVQTEPGLSLRLPFFSNVLTFDRRFLYFNSDPQQMQTRDAERPVLDHYVVWRIADPLKFYASFPSGMSQAEAQIDRVTRSDLREVVGTKTLAEVVTTERDEVMKTITDKSAAVARRVRHRSARRAHQPHRAAGRHRGERLRADAQPARTARAQVPRRGRPGRTPHPRRSRSRRARDRRRCTARRRDPARRGRRPKSARIYAEAHGIAPEFFGFLRRLDAYKKTIGDHTTLVVPPDNDFFELLQNYRAKTHALTRQWAFGAATSAASVASESV